METNLNEHHADTDTVRNPYDNTVVGHMPVSDADAVERSIARAQAAFEIMRRMPRFMRADILLRAADLIESRRDEFVRTIAAESGKPLYDARGEVSRGVFNLRNAAAEARRSHGEEIPLDVDAGVFEYQTTDSSGRVAALSRLDVEALAGMRRRVGIARRFPIGLVLAISPFNFPLNLVLHKVAPAIAVGNAVVLKPAPQTPLTSRLLQEVMRDAGLPEGALEVCHCTIAHAEAMVRDERFGMVTFTGSAKVGWHIKSIAGHKKVALELGGNGAVIVAEDADLDLAAARCVRGGVVFGGQYCIGVQRILVHESVRAQFEEKLLEHVRACRVGNPMEEGIDVGPVIDEKSAARIQDWIDAAREQGARLLAGGPRVGAVVQPTVLADTRPGMLVEDEEIFGPVLTLNSYRSFDEALARANDSRYGLQGGLFTRDLQRAFLALETWDVGGLMINDVPIYRIDNMPFGGWKQSGTGREGTRYAMDEMSEIKLLVVNYS
ncbi:aldehyde dehydrogenase family protein [Burkholderia metallica]|uniref:aldehyde dehydrogenase family protein n=1 Tax=Burkholderia metallica TaxID=488729 RepID=UPI00084139E6|nr:aldehyde dehydrogenase family protein [Burkholderia metallica]AOJ31855.1 aldehyde dehydrogenase [Burkholderia metallica]MCA7999047.1 aldehyde dehydrogenase family protein [Burkholderia metallica]